MAATIANVHPRRLWDSRGRPTIEVEIRLADGTIGSAIAPAGASVGSGEAVDLRDAGAAFGGYDVTKALQSVSGMIAPALVGLDVEDQDGIDALMVRLDGTSDRSRLGGNAIVATSMAVLQAAARSRKVPLWSYLAGGSTVLLPLPEIQIFGGGAHANGRVDIQDFMIMCPAAASFSQALDWTAEVYRAAGDTLKSKGLLRGVADEGGFWPEFQANEDALEMLVRSIEKAGFHAGKEVAISLDIAASNFGKNGKYKLGLDARELDTAGLIELVGKWIESYPILSVEDPLAEDDLDGFVEFSKRFSQSCQIIGDDLVVTNAAKVKNAIRRNAINAVLIKPNQAGTISEAKAAFEMARADGLATIVSARSGETEDVTISHLSVGWNARQLKVGSFSRSERMAKWNECLRIEEAMKSARFAGWSAFPDHIASKHDAVAAASAIRPEQPTIAMGG